MNLVRRGGVLITAVLCGSLLGSAAVADEQVVIAESPERSELSAYGGTVAYSEREPGVGWRLKLWRGGKMTPLSIDPKTTPFDVDLGPDEQGRLTVVYSRCRVEPRGQFLGQGCDLYRYADGRERRIRGVSRSGHSEHHPSIWRNRIAFARYRDEGGGQQSAVDRLYLREEDAVRGLPRGTIRLPGQGFADTDAGVARLDLRGTRVAFSWGYRSDQCPGPQGTPERGDPGSVDRVQIWLAGRDGSRLKVDTGCVFNERSVFSPVLTDRGLFHARALGVLARENSTRSVSLVRSDSSARTREERPATPTAVSVAVGDGVVAELREIRRPDGRTYQVVISD